MLLKAGAKLDLRSTDGLTAYEVAVKEKCDKIAQVFDFLFVISITFNFKI